MKHFVHIRTLIIASKSATTGAAQVQPQVHSLVQPHIQSLAHLYGSISLGASSNVPSGAPFDCIAEWVINSA